MYWQCTTLYLDTLHPASGLLAFAAHTAWWIWKRPVNVIALKSYFQGQQTFIVFLQLKFWENYKIFLYSAALRVSTQKEALGGEVIYCTGRTIR